MNKEKILYLPLKRRWFEEIKAGTKKEEYRLYNKYWRKRILRKDFDKIVLTLGYPPKGDTTRRIELPWRGYELKRIESEEWAGEIKAVFAIKLSE